MRSVPERVALFIAAGTVGAASAAATAPQRERAYAGYVAQLIPRGDGVVRFAGAEKPLNRGDSLLQGDCVGPRTPKARLIIEHDDGTREPVDFDGDRCTTVKPKLTRGFLASAIDEILRPLRRTTPARRGAQWRNGVDRFAGLGGWRADAMLPSGAAALYVNWCSIRPMTVLLYDPEGRLAASTLLIRGRSGVELPSVSLKQGRWHLAFLTGARQDDARHFTLTVDGAQPASHAAPETRGIIGILGDAAMLAREHPDGSRDFAAMQLLQREDNEGVRDGLAEDNFCAG